MATPNQLTPGYRIYRNLTADGSAFDMTAALNFDPPQGSDELFFALKAAYPAVDNHAERTRMAVFDHLLNETTYSTSTDPTLEFMELGDSSSFIDNTQSYDLNGSSTFSSPPGLSPEASQTSPVTASMSFQGQVSATDSPAEIQTPAARQLSFQEMTQHVFAANEKASHKGHVRRSMRPEEKKEYRQRRMTGACEKCRKGKRKCKPSHHAKIAEASARSQPKRVAQRASVSPVDTLQTFASNGESFEIDLAANNWDPLPTLYDFEQPDLANLIGLDLPLFNEVPDLNELPDFNDFLLASIDQKPFTQSTQRYGDAGIPDDVAQTRRRKYTEVMSADEAPVHTRSGLVMASHESTEGPHSLHGYVHPDVLSRDSPTVADGEAASEWSRNWRSRRDRSGSGSLHNYSNPHLCSNNDSPGFSEGPATESVYAGKWPTRHRNSDGFERTAFLGDVQELTHTTSNAVSAQKLEHAEGMSSNVQDNYLPDESIGFGSRARNGANNNAANDGLFVMESSGSDSSSTVENLDVVRDAGDRTIWRRPSTIVEDNTWRQEQEVDSEGPLVPGVTTSPPNSPVRWRGSRLRSHVRASSISSLNTHNEVVATVPPRASTESPQACWARTLAHDEVPLNHQHQENKPTIHTHEVYAPLEVLLNLQTKSIVGGASEHALSSYNDASTVSPSHYYEFATAGSFMGFTSVLVHLLLLWTVVASLLALFGSHVGSAKKHRTGTVFSSLRKGSATLFAASPSLLGRRHLLAQCPRTACRLPWGANGCKICSFFDI